MSEAMERPTMKYGEPSDQTVCRIQTYKSLDQRIHRLKDKVRLSRLRGECTKSVNVSYAVRTGTCPTWVTEAP
jgi:hypothetical protein